MDKFEYQLIDGSSLVVYRCVYRYLTSNMYIMMKSNEALVIDPNENTDIPNLFEQHDVRKVYVILTHEHYDHTNGVPWFLEHFNCTLICNRPCAEIISTQRKNIPRLVSFVLAERDKKEGTHLYQEFKKEYKPYALKADIIYSCPCEFELLGMKFRGIQTPGHSPGSWCLIVDDNIIITGDTLIQQTPALLRFSESNKKEYLNITLPFLKSLNPELLVLPGHYDPFLMKDNKILDAYDV